MEGLIPIFWKLYFCLLEKEVLEIDSEVSEAFKKHVHTNGFAENQSLSMNQCSCGESVSFLK